MTGINSDEVRLAPFGNVYVAPIGTALPTRATVALNAAFTPVGYVDEAGVSISPKIALADIMAWQSATPVKQALDTVSVELKFNMIQVNQVTWSLFFLNEPFVNNLGEAKLTVKSRPPSQEMCVIVEWLDDLEDQTRLVVPRASLGDRDNLQLDKKKEQAMGITIKCLDHSGDLAYVYSENPDLVPLT